MSGSFSMQDREYVTPWSSGYSTSSASPTGRFSCSGPTSAFKGLGEFSRLGEYFVRPFLGPRFKAAVVTTDLPLAPDKPIDFGVIFPS
jgi:hypothetical protein